MNIDFFMKFQKFRIGKLVCAEDYADKFSYQLSTSLYIIFVVIISVRQYIFAPIQCWIPPEWTKSWEEYAENYCWIIDTYTAKMMDGPPLNVTVRTETRISYYQWVPFVLALQCLLFYLPHLVWKVVSQRSANLFRLVHYAASAATLMPEERDKKVAHLGEEILKLIEHCREDVTAPTTCSHTFPFALFGKRSGSCLVMLYFVVKLAYLINAVGQLFLMQRFLQMDTLLFGVTRLVELAGGSEREISGTFPYVSWCDVQRRDVANTQPESFMCVLPVNMLNEKIYIFLWFWEILLISCCSVSFITWIVRITSQSSRRTFVKKYLRMQRNKDANDPEKMKKFVHVYLCQDGVFYLRMIAFNGGELLASEVIQYVYRNYEECRMEIRSRILPGSSNSMHQA